MKLASLLMSEATALIDATIRIAPVTLRIRSPFAPVGEHLDFFYPGAVTRERPDVFTDFDIHIAPATGVRRWFRPQVQFLLEHLDPFLPLPAAQAAPLFEWGLNWCLATRPLGYLVMHAAVVAQDTDALVMPGFPGAGKSTLCAALTFLKGWRLLSDELAILEPEAAVLHPNPRPICLKNASIDIVRAFPGARLGPVYHDTRKGAVTHAAPPATSREMAEKTARCRWVVFPRYIADAPPFCDEITHAEAFARIAEQSFNRDRMGETGFGALCTMLSGALCFEIGYDSTERALQLIADITGT